MDILERLSIIFFIIGIIILAYFYSFFEIPFSSKIEEGDFRINATIVSVTSGKDHTLIEFTYLAKEKGFLDSNISDFETGEFVEINGEKNGDYLTIHNILVND